MRYCRFSTGWVRVVAAYWRASAVQQVPGSDERWRVHIYCAFRTPPYYGGYDSAYLLHAGGKPYSAPLAECIHRAERWYWEMALHGRLCHGPATLGRPMSSPTTFPTGTIPWPGRAASATAVWTATPTGPTSASTTRLCRWRAGTSRAGPPSSGTARPANGGSGSPVRQRDGSRPAARPTGLPPMSARREQSAGTGRTPAA